MDGLDNLNINVIKVNIDDKVKKKFKSFKKDLRNSFSNFKKEEDLFFER